MASSRGRKSISHQHLPSIALFLLSVAPVAKSQPLVPALIIFGDSSMDVGNNNYLSTAVKSDFPPYGRDYPRKKPTGRFCNGKLAVDIIGISSLSSLFFFALSRSLFFFSGYFS